MDVSRSNDELKVIKLNQKDSKRNLNNPKLRKKRQFADKAIAESKDVLISMDKGKCVARIAQGIKKKANRRKCTTKPIQETFSTLSTRANKRYPEDIAFEDIMSAPEIKEAIRKRDTIEAEFSKQTSIKNKTDLSFLAVATALQVLKTQMSPFVAEKFLDYGKNVDKGTRLPHNARSIKERHERTIKGFEEKADGNKKGKWKEMLSRSVPYDITRGSSDLGINMEGGYHRVHTLGHDPILGWLFGTMNILTETITITSPKLSSYRVERHPMRITSRMIPILNVFQESFETAREHKLNLPAALCVQGAHLASDKYTKLGLPVPIIETINENFASKLYHENYDALCFARDVKTVAASAVVSRIMDIVIGIVHGFFRKKAMPKDRYEVKTRKILLISNGIAAGSTIIRTAITENPKDLDIGSLLNFISRWFSDVRFMSCVKHEYIENKIWETVTPELEEVDRIYNSMQ